MFFFKNLTLVMKYFYILKHDNGISESSLDEILLCLLHLSRVGQRLFVAMARHPA